MGRTLRMFQHRVWEMRDQQEVWPVDAVPGIAGRLPLLTKRIFNTYATVHLAAMLPVHIALCCIGLAETVRHAWRWFRRGTNNPAPMVLLLTSAAAAGPFLATPLDWDRYYFLPVVFSTAYIAVGAIWVLRRAWRTHKRPAV